MGAGVPRGELRLCTAGELATRNSPQGSRKRRTSSYLNLIEKDAPSPLPRLLNYYCYFPLAASPDSLAFGCCVANLDAG